MWEFEFGDSFMTRNSKSLDTKIALERHYIDASYYLIRDRSEFKTIMAESGGWSTIESDEVRYLQVDSLSST